MDIWFKAKVDWGEALGLLSDTEAGRFAKAIWKYAATGKAGTLTGREQMLFALVLADLRREAEHRERISALRSEAGRRGGRQIAFLTRPGRGAGRTARRFGKFGLEPVLKLDGFAHADSISTGSVQIGFSKSFEF